MEFDNIDDAIVKADTASRLIGKPYCVLTNGKVFWSTSVSCWKQLWPDLKPVYQTGKKQ